MAQEHKTTVRLPKDLFRQVKAKAALEGMLFSEVCRRLFSAWVSGKIDLSEGPEGQPERKDPG